MGGDHSLTGKLDSTSNPSELSPSLPSRACLSKQTRLDEEGPISYKRKTLASKVIDWRASASPRMARRVPQLPQPSLIIQPLIRRLIPSKRCTPVHPSLGRLSGRQAPILAPCLATSPSPRSSPITLSLGGVPQSISSRPPNSGPRPLPIDGGCAVGYAGPICHRPIETISDMTVPCSISQIRHADQSLKHPRLRHFGVSI